ncbi:palmitoyltransferase ZDHHC6 isoform X3 [Lepeophtheirus salmonis]|uniref:palmitoyltransferase ZDHHC6 isoform X3 n=1 Tax=Lepeophtheirus salmonis TaxID=72036 RepID=UPI001AE39A73|nr:palmitoyltransferase ZDHHC6-like isoform X3 [Lepeophtheirus salmonis]
MHVTRLIHWGPLMTLLIITWVSFATLYSSFVLSSSQSIFQVGIVLFYMTCAALTIYHFISAIYLGPGYLCEGWKPKDEQDSQFLQYCSLCRGYKAPRAHHCRKCQRCVLKMDHHCPWINNCVGHINHGHFISFLFFAIIGSASASYILSFFLYYSINRTWYDYYDIVTEPILSLSIWSLLFLMLALGLSIGVVLAVGALFIIQLRAIIRNRTGIEDWIIEKALYRLKDKSEMFIHPYFLEVISFSCKPASNGIDWPIRAGSGNYDLTSEQLHQKAEKRLRMREYIVTRSYSGYMCPLISQGLKVALHPPLTGEPRIVSNKGDVVKVSRWKKYWLYGDKIMLNSERRVRGWFPRKCAVEMSESFKSITGDNWTKKII